eukprot:scaffold219_cov156-Amphora_coffeaeformis.AAC.10
MTAKRKIACGGGAVLLSHFSRTIVVVIAAETWARVRPNGSFEISRLWFQGSAIYNINLKRIGAAIYVSYTRLVSLKDARVASNGEIWKERGRVKISTPIGVLTAKFASKNCQPQRWECKSRAAPFIQTLYKQHT